MTQLTTPPITLRSDTLCLELDPEKGGRINRLTIDNPEGQPRDLLHHDEKIGASFVMAPWTNRIENARFAFQGTEHAIGANHPDGTAIHGTARELPWTVGDRTPVSARLTLDTRNVPLGASTSFPFRYGACQRFELGDDSLTIDLSVTNLGDSPMPAGCGQHPYFSRTLFRSNDLLTIKAPITGHYPSEHQIPTGEPIDDDFCKALRGGDSFIGAELDEVFTMGNAPIELHWSKSDVRLTIEHSESLGHLVVFTPLAAPFVCVEPTTMANNGFNAKDPAKVGVRVLQPGETIETRMTFRITRGG